MKKPGPVSIANLASYLVLEIAYVYARHVEWAPKSPAHLVGSTSADDDDTAENHSAIDFVNTWSISNPETVPWVDLKLSYLPDNVIKVGHTPEYMLPALIIADFVYFNSKSDPTNVHMISYTTACEAQLPRAKLETQDTIDIEDFVGLRISKPRGPPGTTAT